MKRKNILGLTLTASLLLTVIAGGVTGCGKTAGVADDMDTQTSETETDPEIGDSESRVAEDENQEATEEDINTENGENEMSNETENLACPSNSGQLQVIGTQLCNQDGNPVQLRGISTHGIAWFPQYVNSSAFSEFRNDWGANVMRLAMYTYENGGYCTGGDQAALLATIDTGVNAATENDQYVIIDWHVLNEGNPLTYEDQAKDFWQQISAKYADHNNVIYEICNEPCNGASWSDITDYANVIIPIIRANDEDAVIIVGTPNWSQDVDTAAASPLSGYSNIMYALHFYAGTHKGDLQKKMEAAIGKGLPIFVSEYGITDASGNGNLDKDSAATWISLLDQYGISYVCWNLSNKDESSALLATSCTKTSGFTYEDLSGEGQWLYDLLTSKK